MRLSLTALFFLLTTAVLAQDTPAADGADAAPAPDAAPSPSPAAGGGGGEAGAPPSSNAPGTGGSAGNEGDNENTIDPSSPWNITYFTYPTRNNYWVNDNENKATWSPVNVASNLMLSHSNASILPQRVMLQQNIPGGVGTFATKITGYTPSNNYLLVLTIAGNPDQKLAQSQGFYIKANGTAAPQQVTAQGNQATASAVSNGGSTQPGSGDPAAMQDGAAAAPGQQPQQNADGGAAPTPGGTTAPGDAPSSAAARVGAGVALGAAAATLAAALVAPLFVLS